MLRAEWDAKEEMLMTKIAFVNNINVAYLLTREVSIAIFECWWHWTVENIGDIEPFCHQHFQPNNFQSLTPHMNLYDTVYTHISIFRMNNSTYKFNLNNWFGFFFEFSEKPYRISDTRWTWYKKYHIPCWKDVNLNG